MPTLKLVSFILLTALSAYVCAVEAPGGGGGPQPPNEIPGGPGEGDALQIVPVPGGPPGLPNVPPPPLPNPPFQPPANPVCVQMLGGQSRVVDSRTRQQILTSFPALDQVMRPIKDLPHTKKWEVRLQATEETTKGRFCCANWAQPLPFTHTSLTGGLLVNAEFFLPGMSLVFKKNFYLGPPGTKESWFSIKVTAQAGAFVAGNTNVGVSYMTHESPGRPLCCDYQMLQAYSKSSMGGGVAIVGEVQATVNGIKAKAGITGELRVDCETSMKAWLTDTFCGPPIAGAQICFDNLKGTASVTITVGFDSGSDGWVDWKYSWIESISAPGLCFGEKPPALGAIGQSRSGPLLSQVEAR